MKSVRPIAIIAGTRPEIIKLAPVYFEFRRRRAHVQFWFTGQHTSLATSQLKFFGLRPDLTWSSLKPGQTSNELLGRLLIHLDRAITKAAPRAIVVQGDTTTALAGSVAGFHRMIPVAHVEAGLRTNDLAAPFPEEYNRRVIDISARWRFPPTPLAYQTLKNEGKPSERPTGNTGIDALFWARAKIRNQDHWPRAVERIPREATLILSTGHRRENLDGGLVDVLTSVRAFVSRHESTHWVHVTHPNPRAAEAVRQTLGSSAGGRIQLASELGYADFVALLDRADVVISDSGGIQEEAPSFGLPVLITRDVTERPEVLSCGGRLVGTRPERILAELERTMKRKQTPRWSSKVRKPVKTPFGDGRASERIVRRMLASIGHVR